MSACKEKVPIWRVVILFLACLSIYLYLYTNAFDGMKSSAVYRVVEGDLQAVWKDKFGSVSYYLKLLEKADTSLKIEFSAGNVSKQEQTTQSPTSTVAAKIHSNVNTQQLEKYRSRILNQENVPILTLFTTWNYNPDKNLVHNLTVTNWLSLHPFVIPVVFTNDSDVAADCSRKGWGVLPVLVSAAEGIPVLKYMYRDVMEKYNTTFYAYSNADILFTDTLPDSLVQIITNTSLDLTQPGMIVGKRTNVENVTLDEGSDWYNITWVAKERGKLFTGWAEDYFITTRPFPWHDMAEVVIGRRAYDNWLVVHSRKLKYTVIDATKTVLAVHLTTEAGNFEGHSHKNRDYNHNLLVKMFKRLKYNAGIIECIEKFTAYESGNFSIKDRTVLKGCATG
ncbi:uncharacterized protein LOC128243790 isoform X2 [Mya arenaria]|nr:uncharacterized protein LOC128243790 isoform X2 [Mya arenaria]XP_052817698.1 uncharacterized protein LOC128243790 isoform X2 [Mya arenaria]